MHDWNQFTGRVIHQHITLYDFHLLPESKLNYDIAVFVRNPYDRVVSGFNQILKDINNQPRSKFRRNWVHDLVKNQLAENFRDICFSSYDVNEWFINLPKYKIFNIGSDSSLFLHPNHYWTHINQVKSVSFIGRCEEFENDFQLLCKKYNIEIDDTNISRNISNLNARPNEDNYKYLHLLRNETKERRNHLFKDDFHLLDYKRYD